MSTSLRAAVPSTPGAGRLGSIVVANPGSIPEVAAAASGLARAGHLSRYYLPLAVEARHRTLAERVLPAAIARPVARELNRRPIPAAVDERSVAQVAAASHLACVAVTRLPLPASMRIRMFRRHGRIFDARVGRLLTRDDRAVLTVASAALHTLTAAKRLDITSFLDCPIAHHRVAAALLQEEARRVPEFACTLQFHDTADATQEALDQELQLADWLLTLSAFATRTFIEAGVDERRIVQIPPGVDTELFRPRPRPADGVFRVLFVGQVTQRKGISYLLDAFEAAAIPSAELMFVGRAHGSREPWLARRGVRHVPAVARADLTAFYAQADVFVMPSLVEGSCLTALEAMASGLPLIVSENTGTNDLIVDGREGYVVPIRDSAAIAERLGELHADPDLRARVGRAARQRAETLGWDTYGRRIAEVVGELS